MEFKQNMLFVSGTPYYVKDSKGKKTDVVKGYIVEMLEYSKDKDGDLNITSFKSFPAVNDLSSDVKTALDSHKIKPFTAVEAIFDIETASGTPKFKRFNVLEPGYKSLCSITVNIPQI